MFIEACLAGTIRTGTFDEGVRAFRTDDVEAWISGLNGAE